MTTVQGFEHDTVATGPAVSAPLVVQANGGNGVEVTDASVGEAVASPFAVAIEEFCTYMASRNFSKCTLATYGHALGYLGRFLADRGITDPGQVTVPVLETYRYHLTTVISRFGRPLTPASQASRIQAARAFFRYLKRAGYVDTNPALELEPPRKEFRLPPATLTVPEIEAVLALPDTGTPFGLRDRAILEVFYSTAIRRAELVHVKLCDVDFERGTIFIYQGKGHKDRYVPVGTRALHWLSRYITEVRPRLAAPGDADEGTVFLAYTGRALSNDFLTEMVTNYIAASGTGKHGSCHLIRHSTATLMLEGGADIRIISELLGHAQLETTRKYTRVSIHQLRQVHAMTHPGASLSPDEIPAATPVDWGKVRKRRRGGGPRQ